MITRGLYLKSYKQKRSSVVKNIFWAVVILIILYLGLMILLNILGLEYLSSDYIGGLES